MNALATRAESLQSIPTRRADDAEFQAMPNPPPMWLMVAFWISYAAVFVAVCWLAEVDVVIAHAWHWLGSLLA